jgi:hypothetical protein
VHTDSVQNDSVQGYAVQGYAVHSRVTDPGRFADRVGEVPGDLSSMRHAARQLVFHYRAGGDFTENGVALDRIAEIDTRYARDMLARIFQLADRPLARQRAPCERLVGCCRDFTVLFLAIARQHGVPARARVGFATYFRPGWFVDHVVAEVWDEGEQRWRLVDPELADDHIDPSDQAAIDPLDIPADRFRTGPQAWQSCRAGTTDAERFVVDPGLQLIATRGWPYVRHNLIHDLASLAKHEMLLWDDWGLSEFDAEPTPAQLDLLDELAVATAASGTPVDQILSFYGRDEFRVPSVVTSYSPAHEAPLQVEVEVEV